MRIRISEPALIGDLLEYFRRNGCLAIQTSRDIVAVSLADGLPYDAARIALELHVADWLREHANARASIID